MDQDLSHKKCKSLWRPLVIAFNYIYGTTGILIIILAIWMSLSIAKVEDLVSKDSETELSLFLAVFGAMILFISVVSSNCIDKPIHMFVYSSTLLTLAILNLTFGGLLLAYRGRIPYDYQRGIQSHMSTYVMDDSTLCVMDKIQSALQCCGNIEPFDWYKSPIEQIPPSCCKKKLCDPSNIEEIYTEGCFTKVYDLLNINTSVVDMFVFATAFVPMVGALVVFLLAYETFINHYQRRTDFDEGSTMSHRCHKGSNVTQYCQEQALITEPTSIQKAHAIQQPDNEA